MPAHISTGGRRATTRRLAVVVALATGLVLTAPGTAIASGPAADHLAPPTATTEANAPGASMGAMGEHCGDTRGGRLDGFAINVVPDGVGPNVSDFEYEWEDVEFTSRVWESGPDADGAYRVDLNVKVLRGERLRDLPALLDFLAYYHERDLDSWELADYAHPDGPGYVGDGEAFWLIEPGVAISVRLAGERFDADDLQRTADGVRQLDD